MFDKFTVEELEELYAGHRELVRAMRAEGKWGPANYHAARATEIAVHLAQVALEARALQNQIPLFTPEYREPGAA
jgi:hypothetical protein